MNAPYRMAESPFSESDPFPSDAMTPAAALAICAEVLDELSLTDRERVLKGLCSFLAKESDE